MRSITLPPFSRNTLTYCHDLVMTGFAFLVALFARVGNERFFSGEFNTAIFVGLPVLVCVAAVVYRFFGLYRGLWRYASMHDLLQILKAVVVTILVFVLAMYLILYVDVIPRSVPFILCLVLLAFLGGPRFVYRILKDRGLTHFSTHVTDKTIPVLLIGAGDQTESFLRSLNTHAQSPYCVVGIVDDRRGARVGVTIRGVPVLGHLDDLDQIVTDLNTKGLPPQRLVLTRPRAELDGRAVRTLLDHAERLGLGLSRLPSPTDFQDAAAGDKHSADLRPIAIEDLLGRPQTALDTRHIQNFITGKTILITGAGGTIGGELSRQIAAFAPSQLIVLENSEYNVYAIEQDVRARHPGLSLATILCDVRDNDRIQALFAQYRPDIVFHAAALKHVTMVERNKSEAILTNSIGTKNIADAARQHGVSAFVFISTDKAVKPSSVMEASKRVAELYCQALDMQADCPTRFVTVRFGNVLGSSGSVVPLFQKQVAAGGPITVTHPEMKRYFMTVREAVELVLQAASHGLQAADRGKICVLDMGEPIKIVDLARQLIRLVGLRPDVDIAIHYTGIQPGEKLFEEILDESEQPQASVIDRVYVATPTIMDYAQIEQSLLLLHDAARSGNDTKIMALLSALLPDFASQRQG